MKIKFDIECTPEEARTFLGLPDVKPMQDALIKEMQAKMQDNIQAMDPETMMKTWMPLAIQNMTDFQKMFWDQFAPIAQGHKKQGDKK